MALTVQTVQPDPHAARPCYECRQCALKRIRARLCITTASPAPPNRPGAITSPTRRAASTGSSYSSSSGSNSDLSDAPDRPAPNILVYISCSPISRLNENADWVLYHRLSNFAGWHTSLGSSTTSRGASSVIHLRSHVVNGKGRSRRRPPTRVVVGQRFQRKLYRKSFKWLT
jgi:hypothetical protein